MEMVTPAWAARMARYNRWQNDNLFGAADGLSEADRRADRGAFFGGVHDTLSHILWADRVWMARLADWPAVDCALGDSPRYVDEWTDLKRERAASDERFIAWADAVEPTALRGELTWHSAATGKTLTRPRAVLFMQVFNHQTHHRGQVHAMLTQAGARPSDTDLPFMPEAFL